MLLLVGLWFWLQSTTTKPPKKKLKGGQRSPTPALVPAKHCLNKII